MIWFGTWVGYYFLTDGYSYDNQSSITQALIHLDAVWYVDIARHGYSYISHENSQQNIAFFPLYPMMIRLASLFGFHNIIAIIPSIFLAFHQYTLFIICREQYCLKLALYLPLHPMLFTLERHSFFLPIQHL